jgi:alpha,alpha-trehalose phosphorylase
MRDHGDILAFAPRLPSRLTRLRFRLVYRGRRLRVDVCSDFVEYELLDGEPLELIHHGDALTVGPESPERRSIPPAPRRSAPEQPPGRSPPRRHRET